MEVDIVTSGCGGSLPVTARTTRDGAGTDPVAWTSQEFLVVGQQPIAPQSRIDAVLANVASLEIDTSDFTGACLAGDLIEYEVTTDGATRVAFSDGSALDFPGAGVYTGTLPEPGSAASLAAGALLVAALARRRSR